MGLFSERKPYTAISVEIEALLHQGPDRDPGKLLNLVELIQGTRPPEAGAHEAGRALRKKLKHGGPDEQRRALGLVELLIDNGVRGNELVGDTGLGEQISLVASGQGEPSRGSKAAKQAQSLLSDWSRRKDPNLSRWFKHAGLADRPPRRPIHPDDDLDAEGFRERDGGGRHARGRSTSSRRSWMSSPSASPRPAPARSRSPSPINLRGAGLTTTIATAHNVSTRLTNALITNRPGSRETEEYYQQAKQLRRRIIQLVHDPSGEVQQYVGQLLQANEELIASLQAYDAVSDGRQLAAQDDHESHGLPASPRTPISPVRPPPLPGSGRSAASRINNDEEDQEDEVFSPKRSSKKKNLVDLDDPFADSYEQDEHPKHTPFW